METVPLCNGCQQPLPKNAPEGLCPACLAKAALETERESPGPTININPVAEAVPGTRIPPDSAQLATQFPQLEIIELLGMGGMGMVYKARQPRLDRFVALKILPLDCPSHPSFAERFNREARALAKLNHPGIVTVYDFGQTDQYYYFVMEYVDGMNLRRLLNSQSVTPHLALELVVQICTALQYAHDEGVVHRDIKPENILINKKGQVKIADFGLAKLLGGAPDTALTMSQAAMGTLNYMAPEQRENAQKVDHRADIYSLGVVFYEMLTGELPMGRFVAPSQKVEVDVRLDEVVLKSLAREPERRHQQASEVKTQVEGISKQPPKRASKGQPAGLTPGSFWFIAFGIFFAGWLLSMILCNFGAPGWAVAALAMAILFVGVGLKRMWLFPEQVAIWRKISLNERVGPILLVALLCGMGLLFVMGGAYDYWERSGVRRNFQTRTDTEFEKEFKGKEYELIRGLRAFRQQIPTVELVPQGGRWFGGWTFFGWTGPSHRLRATSSLWLGCFALLASCYGVIGGWRVSGTSPLFPFSWRHLRAACALFASLMGSGVFFYCALASVYLFSRSSGVQEAWVCYCASSIEEVTTNINTWLGQNGFATGDDYNWAIANVPQGQRVGEVRLREAWKPIPSDRWHFGWRGLERISPWLTFRFVASDKPAETVVQVSSAMDRTFPKIPAGLTALIGRLADPTGGAGAIPVDIWSRQAENGAGPSTNRDALKLHESATANLIVPGLYESTTIEQPNQAWQKTRLVILKGNVGNIWRRTRRVTGQIETLESLPLVVLKDPAGNIGFQISDSLGTANPTNSFVNRVVEFKADGLGLDNGEILKRQP